MKRRTRCFIVSIVAVVPMLALNVSAQDSLERVAKLHAPYTIPLALEFSRKSTNPVTRVLSWGAGVLEANGHATGFLVGDGLVMTSYHVVSGKLDATKKHLLSFKPDDELAVDIYVYGCQAKVIKIDPGDDLALLRTCTSRQAQAPTFRTSPRQDERLFVIAQPGEQKLLRRGSFNGTYAIGNAQYLSVKIDGQDGFSGSPVYDNNGEIVGIFSRYGWNEGVALLSPATRVQQFLAEYGLECRPEPGILGSYCGPVFPR
jgi:S1-C subfamily serine protease